MRINFKPKTLEEYSACLDNKLWRLNNLYFVKNKDGNKVRFKMWPAQLQFHKERHNRNLVLKCRQRGFTTYIEIDMLDECVFVPNTNGGVIAHNLEDATAFFTDKIKYAYDNMPQHIKARCPAKNDNQRELRFDNGSVIRVGTSLRSGTYQRLHISEHGKLCAQNPKRAMEVRAGAMETVPLNGLVDIESTAEGRGGDFFDYCQTAMNHEGDLNALDYKFHFFPWWEERDYSLDAEVFIDEHTERYFGVLEEAGIKLTNGQKAWYVQKSAQLKDKMKQEYPSTPEEAFEASIEGAYFSRQMSHIRSKGQITHVPIVPNLPIYTFWDLGRDTTAIWFFQEVGFDYRFVDYYENDGEGMSHYVDVLRSKMDGDEPYRYGECFLPHDGTHRSMAEDRSPEDVLYQNGFYVQIVPRTPAKENSIERARNVIPLCWFDKDHCKDGLKRLDGYRKEWDDRGGTWKKNPAHDKNSHGADAFMVFGDAWTLEREQEDEDDQVRQQARNRTTGY